MKKHLANVVSFTRILGVCLIFLWTPFKSLEKQHLVVIIYIILASTDWLDGVLARSRFGQITNLGKILDPMADKILILVYLPILEMGQITSFPVFVLLARDIMVTTLRVFAAQQGEIMAAKLSGKIRTAISLPLAGILLCRVQVLGQPSSDALFLTPAISWIQSWPINLVNTLIWLLVTVTVASLIHYFGVFFSNEKNRRTLFS